MTHLERLAARVEDDPFFLGLALAEYARSQRLDDAALVDRLGCIAENLPMLRLCRMPADEPPAFQRDLERIAERFGASADVLAEAVRLAQVIGRFRRTEVTGHGSALAARDAEPPADEPPEQP